MLSHPTAANVPKAPMPETIPPLPTEQVTVVIGGYSFQLVAPYYPGMPLGVAEAGILNREWTQSVRLGFQGRVTGTIDHSDGKLTHEQIAGLQLDFQHYADEFAFKALVQRNGDPLTKAKHGIAKKILDIRLNAAGATKETYGEHKYEAALARLMNNPEVIRQAEQQLAQSREVADELAGITDV